MPLQYETCNPRDLVIVISSILKELIRINDAIRLCNSHLIHSHSRASPRISIPDYLQCLTALSPSILLTRDYYIDRVNALYSALAICSLTVRQFLITSATVASKGLSDRALDKRNICSGRRCGFERAGASRLRIFVEAGLEGLCRGR